MYQDFSIGFSQDFKTACTLDHTNKQSRNKSTPKQAEVAIRFWQYSTLFLSRKEEEFTKKVRQNLLLTKTCTNLQCLKVN